MLFITCSPIEKINDTFHFDPLKVSSSEELFYCRKLDNGFEVIDSKSFMQEIKVSDYKQILIYIHGFNNNPSDSLNMAKMLQDLFDYKNKKEVLVIPIIWSCGERLGLIRDYWSDQQSADMSGFALSRGLSKFVAWQTDNINNQSPCFKYVSILSHSMGNRVLRSMISKFTKYSNNGYTPLLFRNIFMVAADVANDTLERGNEGNCISYATKNLVTYYAGDDQALRGSKIININASGIKRRLGHSGPTLKTELSNLISIDCDAYNSKYDILGHTYFLNLNNCNLNKNIKECDGVIFNHINNSLITGKVENKLEKFNIVKNILGAK